MRRLIHSAIFLLLLVFALPLAAQDTGGQFWVQVFEDRNGNAQHDAGEPYLTRGVSVDLLNAEGIVMATGELDGATYATQGYIGFLYLTPGNYTAVITSPELTATTPERLNVTIPQDMQPVKVMFGAQRAAAENATAATPLSSSPLLNSELARIALSGFGGLLVVMVMGALGLLVYALVFRPRAPKDVRRTSTGTMPVVRVYETGNAPRVEPQRESKPEPKRKADKKSRNTAASRLAGDLGREAPPPPPPPAATSPLDQTFQRPPSDVDERFDEY
jgi:hypothetical protein